MLNRASYTPENPSNKALWVKESVSNKTGFKKETFTIVTFYLLAEDGSYLTTESGNKLLGEY